MPVRRIQLCLLALLLALFFFLAPIASAEPKLKYFSITKGRLVFSHMMAKGRPADLWVVDFSNLEVTQLTKTPYSEAHPRWSPDGRWIVFDANKDGNKDIFVVSWDGTLLNQLTKTSKNEEAPDWSPDGKSIVFYRKGDSEKKYIYSISPDGSNERPLAGSMKNASTPRWSPRGDEVLFSTNKYWPGWDIGVVKIRTAETFPLSAGKRTYARPTWHPLGTQLAFGYGSGDDFDIFSVLKGKKTPTKIASRPGRDTDPEWTTDARHLFFVSEVTKGERDYQVFVKDFKQEKISQVTASSGSVRFPSYTPHPSIEKYSPDGSKLVRPERFFKTEEEEKSENINDTDEGRTTSPN